MRAQYIKSDLLRYIVENELEAGDHLPRIKDVSREMGVGVSKMRESLEVARVLDAVDIRPGSGTRVKPYSFAGAASISALYALGLDSSNFGKLRRLRNQVEIAFWAEAVPQLTEEDLDALRSTLTQAEKRLSQTPIQVPAREHRALHMRFFRHLENPFVTGILEAYWETYNAFAPNLHFTEEYLHKVWDYHARIVECISRGSIEKSRTLLSEHMDLIRYKSPKERGPILD